MSRAPFLPLLLFLLAPCTATAQCILANPSFEVGASGSQVFGGWNQFGVVGTNGDAEHGQLAARITGAQGFWEVSALWQRLDSAEGDRWRADVTVWHDASRPLVGSSRALLNVEWRDASGQLLDYASHTVLDASDPIAERRTVSVLTEPAPAGTAAAHLLLGVLQSPTDPVGEASFDLARFELQTEPSIEERQWADFPGGRALEFAGRTWRVKGPGWYDPGSANYCDGPECLWVDAAGDLHLTVDDTNGPWHSVEVALTDSLGYGDYLFSVRGAVDQLDPQVVLGLFLWEYGPCWSPSFLWWNPFNEIDVELSRWGDPGNDVAQFVAQPFDWGSNIRRFDFVAGEEETTSHAFRWLADRVEFRSWRGGPDDESPENLLQSFVYAGPHVPRPERPRVHINFWHLLPPASAQEVVVDDFRFVPWCGDAPCEGPVGVAPTLPALELSCWPNPFNPRTWIEYTVPAVGPVLVDVFDLAGRRVRTLVRASQGAGTHAVAWDGTDAAGRPVGSGVYVVRVRWLDRTETSRVSLLK